MPYMGYKDMQENEKHIFQLNIFVLLFPVFASHLLLDISLFKR